VVVTTAKVMRGWDEKDQSLVLDREGEWRREAIVTTAEIARGWDEKDQTMMCAESRAVETKKPRIPKSQDCKEQEDSIVV